MSEKSHQQFNLGQLPDQQLSSSDISQSSIEPSIDFISTGSIIRSEKTLIAPNYYLTQFVNGWLPYLTSWTATISNPAIGNGTLLTEYTRIGHTIMVRFRLTIGTTTTVGSGTWRWSFPLPAKITAANFAMGILHLEDAGTRGFIGNFKPTNATSFQIEVLNSGATNYADVTDAAPITWANNDSIRGTFMYETSSIS